MKKLLLFAVVLSGVALTSCGKKIDCHCEKTSIAGTEELEMETKGTCAELAADENTKLTNLGTVTTCEEH